MEGFHQVEEVRTFKNRGTNSRQRQRISSTEWVQHAMVSKLLEGKKIVLSTFVFICFSINIY